MKHVGKLSLALISLTLIGGGCGSAAQKPADQAAGGIEPTQLEDQKQQTAADQVKAKLTAAGIAFSEEDKTAAVTGAVSNPDVRSAFGKVTNFKFSSGPTVRLMVVEANEGRTGIVQVNLMQQFDAVKAQAPKYESKFIKMDDANSVVQMYYSSDDASAAAAIESALSK